MNRIETIAILTTCALAAAVLCAASCAPAQPRAAGAGADGEALRRAFHSHKKAALVVPSSGSLRSRADALVARYRSFGGPLEVRVAEDVRSAPAPDESVILVGGAATNRRIAELLPLLPVEEFPGGFRFGGKEYADADAWIQALVPDAPLPSRAVLVVLGNTAESTMRGVASALFSGLSLSTPDVDYRIAGRGMLQRTGRFLPSPLTPWRIDPASDRDEERERDVFYAGLREHRYPGGIVVRSPVDIETFAERWGADRVRALSRVSPQPAVTFVLYHDIVEKGRFTGDVSEAHRDPAQTGVVHAVVDSAAAVWADLTGAEAALLRDGAAVPGRRPWLLAGEAALRLGPWRGREPAEWCALFEKAGVLPAVKELLAEQKGEDQSPLVFIPAAARFATVIRERFGAGRWSELLRGGPGSPSRKAAAPAAGGDGKGAAAAASGDGKWAPGPANGKGAEREGEGAMDEVWGAEASLGARPPASRGPDPARVPRPQKGACLAHVNNLLRGYASEDARRTLDHLRDLGVSWISVTPFGFVRSVDDDRIGFVLESPFAETDSQMRTIIAEARRRGLHVLYKPHLWVGGPGWVGDITMRGEDAWARWFASYRRFAVHHALLAAECGAEGFVAGTELVKTSGREREWRGVIDAVRTVAPGWSGWVTYGANWYGEFEQVRFWDALDAVGIDLYQPLSADPHASDSDLLQGALHAAAGVESVARRFGRPAVLTEVGLASRPAAWTEPHQEVRGAPRDERAQERGYRAIVEAFRGREWLAGLYWWKYESSSRTRGEEASLTPRGKAAEEVIRQYYAGSSSGSGPAGAPVTGPKTAAELRSREW